MNWNLYLFKDGCLFFWILCIEVKKEPIQRYLINIYMVTSMNIGPGGARIERGVRVVRHVPCVRAAAG